MISCKDSSLGSVVNVPTYGPMKVKEKAAGTVRLETPEGINFWLDEDRMVHGPLGKNAILKWATAYKKNELHSSVTKLKEWATAIAD